MTQEEKAKRYDKVLEWATEAHKVCDGMLKEDLEHLFPELKESEDKMMIQYFKDLAPFDKADELYEKYGFSHKDAIAWLEKQAEHANFINNIQIGDKVTRNEDGVLVNLSQLNRVAKKDEKQGKNNMGISETTKQKLEDNLNKALEKETPESLNKFIDEHGSQILANSAKTCKDEQKSEEEVDNLHDYLYGEQKPAWSEEDEKILNLIIARLHSHPNVEAEEYGKDYHWFKALKDRVQPKQEWSEDDVRNIQDIDSVLFYDKNLPEDTRIRLRNWLKSLKERVQPQKTWKPSDEQMDALHYVTNFDYGGHKATLVSLYEQLKKLKA